MNRRAFLTALAAGLVGATVDVDQLLWVPGSIRFVQQFEIRHDWPRMMAGGYVFDQRDVPAAVKAMADRIDARLAQQMLAGMSVWPTMACRVLA